MSVCIFVFSIKYMDSSNDGYWKRNLAICLYGSFATVFAMTLVLPFLPLYVEELGVRGNAAIVQWSGIAFGANFLAAGLIAPLWGHLGDRFGRKPMLVRASLGMALTMPLMGMSTNIWQFVGLRLLAGIAGGYSSGATILIAVPRKNCRSRRAHEGDHHCADDRWSLAYTAGICDERVAAYRVAFSNGPFARRPAPLHSGGYSAQCARKLRRDGDGLFAVVAIQRASSRTTHWWVYRWPDRHACRFRWDQHFAAVGCRHQQTDRRVAGRSQIYIPQKLSLLFMSESLSIDAKKSVLLLMDFQNFVLDNFVARDAADKAIHNASTLLEASRAASMLTVHVNVGFRPGYPEISSRNKLFTMLKGSGLITPGSEATKIHSKLAPLETEPVVVKHRIGAFSGTDLERILRAQDIDTLILAGVTTSGVVLSTARQAFDLDVNLVVAGDACVDSEEQVHAVLLERVISQHALIASSAQLEAALSDEAE